MDSFVPSNCRNSWSSPAKAFQVIHITYSSCKSHKPPSNARYSLCVKRKVSCCAGGFAWKGCIPGDATRVQNGSRREETGGKAWRRGKKIAFQNGKDRTREEVEEYREQKEVDGMSSDG